MRRKVMKTMRTMMRLITTRITIITLRIRSNNIGESRQAQTSWYSLSSAAHAVWQAKNRWRKALSWATKMSWGYITHALSFISYKSSLFFQFLFIITISSLPFSPFPFFYSFSASSFLDCNLWEISIFFSHTFIFLSQFLYLFCLIIWFDLLGFCVTSSCDSGLWNCCYWIHVMLSLIQIINFWETLYVYTNIYL